MPLGDFLLAFVCTIEKVTQWVNLVYLTPGSEIDEGVAKTKVFAELGIERGTSGLKPSTPSTRLSLGDRC